MNVHVWKSLSRVQLFATPWTTQSMEISRPEYWSGQTFPSLGNLPNPGIKPRSPAMQADCLPAEPQGKPKNTPVSRLSLLRQIFLTQELNQGLLDCRRILYQLSYQGSSCKWIPTANNHVDRTQKGQLKKLKQYIPFNIFPYFHNLAFFLTLFFSCS